MPDFWAAGLIERRCQARVSLSFQALRSFTCCRLSMRLHGHCAPRITMGTCSGPANTDRIRVRTITITAPQHAHRIGARALTQASAGAGANFSSRCSKAIRRLQLGCRKPKLRALRKPLGSTCCSTSHRNCAPDTVRRSSLPVLPLRLESKVPGSNYILNSTSTRCFHSAFTAGPGHGLMVQQVK